jgi:hypothetical protein
MKARYAVLVASLLIVVGFLLLPKTGRAQSVNAAVHGSVKDAAGAVVPGATVTALNTSTGISTVTKTDGSGYYIFPALVIGGPYTITVTQSGFQDFQSTGLMLNVNANREVDAKLTVGSAAQTVTVKSATVQVQTSDTQLKTIIGGKEIVDLPLLNRNAVELEKTAPGVMESSDRFGTFSANGSQTSETSFLLDGTDVNDAPLQSAGVTPNPDALAEFNVITSTLNPEFSRNSGAIINEIIKSGTNQIHGDAFEFYRDTFLNNGNYFSVIRPQYHQNLYGGTLGGPIFKNKAFFFLAYQGLRNRTGVTQLTPVPAAGQVSTGNFTADQNQLTSGINGGTGGTGLSTNGIPFAMTGTTGPCAAGTPWNVCFAPNAAGQIIVPVSNYNPIASKLTSTYVPAPNQVRGGKSYYNFNAGNTQAQDQGIIRLDYELTRNDALWASTIFQSSPSTETLSFLGATLPGFEEVDARHIKIFNASYTHTFNASTLNELRVGYYRFNYAAVEPAKVIQPSSAGFAITPQSPSASLPYIGVTGFFDLGFSQDGPQPRIDTNTDFTDNFSKIAGNHSLKFGAHVEKFLVNNPFYFDNNGAYTFSGTGTFSSGDPLIDYLTGIPDSYAQNSGGIIDAVAWEDYFYGQDNWKVTDALTLNYGMGYDLELPFANYQYGGLGVYCWQANNAHSRIFPTAPPGLLYPGDPGCNKYGGNSIKYKNFGPRVGFAWSPDSGPEDLIGTQGAHLFSLRGGFGIYYNRDQEEGTLQNLADAPFGLATSGATDVGGNPSFANPFQDVANRPGLSEPNKFPFVPPTPSQYAGLNFNVFEPLFANSISPGYAVPYTANYNLNIQRALPSNMILQIGYVGSLGRKLIRAYEADQITPAGHAACLANPACIQNRSITSALFPQYFTQPGVNSAGNPYYYTVGRQHTDGSSNYNSLQVQLTKQTSHGLYFTLAYTYSHALDNSSGYESSSGGGGPNDASASVNWVPGFQYLSYGDSDYDARHRFVALYNYEVPLLRGMNDKFLVREILGGWHVTGTTTLQTGFPVGIFQGGNNRSLWCNGSSTSYYGCSDVPETSTFHIPTLNPRATGNRWFSAAPFSTEPLGTFGNVKRNFLHGPGYNYTNLELYKNFPIGGPGTPRNIELRLESYNTFNHANFANPDGNFSDGLQFGQVTNVIQPGTGDPQPGRSVQLGAKFYF